MAANRVVAGRLPPISQSADYTPRSNKRLDGLDGPTYRLSGSNIKYGLPPPGALRPYVDTNAGELDTWPAHASGHATSSTAMALNKDKQLVLVNEEEMGKPQLIPKPRFLDQLESFLKKELRALGVTQVKPDELRLQAHREVFEYLIEDFKTYKPLLSAIKNEYEIMLAHQREQIRQLEPLKQMLVTVSEQCDQKIMQQRENEKQDYTDLKRENANLYKKLDDMRNEQKTLEETINKLKEELSDRYEMYRNECDARKLLISEINDLKSQQEDLLMSSKAAEITVDKDDDPVMLKIALKKAREDEMAAAERLAKMEADYGDVIPRRDFEALEATHKALTEAHETSVKEFEALQEEHTKLQDIQEQLVKQRDEFYQECEMLRRSATPRPDWEKCADTINGGMERWKELSEGKTSNELVDVLLDEIVGGAAVDKGSEFFEGMGKDESIPRYLQFEGQIPNRRLGKRDVALLLKDIWREKAAHDAEKTDGVRESMSDFLYIYLERRFSIEQMIFEWGYNLHDACQRFAHDEKIGFFWNVLTNEVDEELYYVELQGINGALNSLTKKDAEKNGEEKLTKEDMISALSGAFPDKDGDMIDALILSAEVELEVRDGEMFEYKKLFMEDEDGKTGQFVDELKSQMKATRQEYLDEIKLELGEVTEVSVDDMRKAITITDPEIDQAHMDKYLCWMYRTDRETIEDSMTLPIDEIFARAITGNISRVGQKF